MSAWIPMLPTVLLKHKEVLQAFVEDLEVVIWRSEQGRAQIWENRCPHRSVRLSLGEVHGESLICAYHGWQFAVQTGQCQKIPALTLPRIPTSLCAYHYKVAEQHGMIWFARQNTDEWPTSETDALTHYAGSVLMDASIQKMEQCLKQWGEQAQPWEWQCNVPCAKARIWLTPTSTLTTMVHAFAETREQAQAVCAFLYQVKASISHSEMNYA